jgi:hypothetical protein
MNKYIILFGFIIYFSTSIPMEQMVFEPGPDAVVIAVGQKNIEALKKFFIKDAQDNSILDVNMRLEGGTNTPLGLALEDYQIAVNDYNSEEENKSVALIKSLLQMGAKPDLLKPNQMQTYNYFRKLPLSLKDIAARKTRQLIEKGRMSREEVRHMLPYELREDIERESEK